MTTLDRYGGTAELGRFEATGFFRIVRGADRRFLLVTPEGNGFWLRACYGIDITDGGSAFVDSLRTKYRNDPTFPTWGYWFAFVAQAVRLLRQNGFNALGEYMSNYALPIESHSRGRANSEKMPFLAIINAANYGKKYGVKDVMQGVDTEITPGLWRVEGFPDVFDPAFARAVDELTAPLQSPWLLGTATDDRDYVFGFGASRDFNGWHNHLGWQAAATRPMQDRNGRVGITYSDRTVYTKLAFRDFLREKYRTLEQL